MGADCGSSNSVDNGGRYGGEKFFARVEHVEPTTSHDASSETTRRIPRFRQPRPHTSDAQSPRFAFRAESTATPSRVRSRRASSRARQPTTMAAMVAVAPSATTIRGAGSFARSSRRRASASASASPRLAPRVPRQLRATPSSSRARVRVCREAPRAVKTGPDDVKVSSEDGEIRGSSSGDPASSVINDAADVDGTHCTLEEGAVECTTEETDVGGVGGEGGGGGGVGAGGFGGGRSSVIEFKGDAGNKASGLTEVMRSFKIDKTPPGKRPPPPPEDDEDDLLALMDGA